MKSVHSMSTESWLKELSALVASAKTEEDLAALTAFEMALSPYLNNPGALRTLLGKIAAVSVPSSFDTIISERNFKSLDELKAILPENMELVAA